MKGKPGLRALSQDVQKKSSAFTCQCSQVALGDFQVFVRVEKQECECYTQMVSERILPYEKLT